MAESNENNGLGPPPNPLTLESDQGKLDRLMIELERSDVMMHDNIIDSYRDLMLSDNFLFLMKQTNQMPEHSYETRWDNVCYQIIYTTLIHALPTHLQHINILIHLIQMYTS